MNMLQEGAYRVKPESTDTIPGGGLLLVASALCTQISWEWFETSVRYSRWAEDRIEVW